MSLQTLREQRDEKVTAIRALHAKNDWSAETDQPQFDTLSNEIADIDTRIANHNKMNEMAAANAQRDQIITDAERVAKDQRSPASALFAKWLRGGDNALTAEDWAAHRESIVNTLSTTADAEGGFTVQTDVATSVLDALKAFGGMRNVADVFTTGMGNPIQYPTSDGTAELGEWVAQNTTATDEDPDFGSLTLGVHKASSKVVTVPIELLQDSQVDIEAFVRARQATRLGRITNAGYTTGTGTAQPHGIITDAGVGVAAASGGATAISYDNLVDLEHSIDPAYRMSGQCTFMMHDSALKSLKKLKDADGRPIFLPAYDLAASGRLGELLGYPVEINQQMAEPGANAKSVAFGDFKYYKIRDVLDMQMFRFTDSAFTKKGQVGFLTWMRTGGRLIDVGGAVKTFQHSAT